jgi:hypothetical protein
MLRAWLPHLYRSTNAMNDVPTEDAVWQTLCDACFAQCCPPERAETWPSHPGYTVAEDFAPATAMVGLAFLLQDSQERQSGQRKRS